MPAINALLPIVAASNKQKESTQTSADESRLSAAKDAASAKDKGLAQDAAAEKRLQEKRFINAYEEGIQEQGRQQERRAHRVAVSEQAQRDDAAALAASGNALPQEGAPLPIAAVPSTQQPAAHSSNDEANKPPQQQAPGAPSTPIVQTSSPAEQSTPPVSNGSDTLSADQQQRQAAGEAFHALVSARNGKADAKVEGKAQDILVVEQQRIASAASLQVQQTDMAEVSDLAMLKASTQASAQALASAQQDVASTPAQSAEQLSTQAQPSQSAATLATAIASNEALTGAEQPEQAQLVRAWRGIESQELRSGASLITQASAQAATQTARQDSNAASVPIALSGQIQQFAQSLRLASAKPDAAVNISSAAAGERSAPSAAQSSAENSAWRADSASANAASTSARATAASTPFAQSMQASNFGQALGTAVGQNAWGESIAQRVSLMAGLKVSSAQIQLDPPELGAMTVKVSVNGDQASVSFHSPHAVVRDALELSFPRLQEMMGQQGLQLADAQVSDNSSAGKGSGESTSGSAGQSRGEAQEEGSGNTSPQIVKVATGLIDFYA